MTPRRIRHTRSAVRRVGPADTAASPLPARLPVRRLWTLLAVVALLALAALLAVYRPWTGIPSNASGNGTDEEYSLDG